MAKPPRPSIADRLAQIAASSPDSVTASPRGNVEMREADDVGEQRIRSSAPEAEEPLPRGNVTTRPRGNVTPEGYKIRQRVEKPHVSLYAHPKVFKKIREIAATEGCKPHDVYVEGLRLILAKYGVDYDKLDRVEG